MKTIWFSHLKTQEEQDNFKQTVLGSANVLDRLTEVCYNIVSSKENPSAGTYDNPNWAYLQADTNGYTRAFKEVMALLDLSDKDTKPPTS